MIKTLVILMIMFGGGCAGEPVGLSWRQHMTVPVRTPKSFYKQHFPHSEKPWPSNRHPKWTERRPTQVV